MSKEEMVQNLGTIARSGSKIFVEELAKMKKEETLNVVPEAIIGQVNILK
jgi:HSP90 family molecular chaperone